MTTDRARYGWTDAGPGPGPAHPLRINNSTFSVIAACTTATALKWHDWASAEETAAMRAGTAAHAALALHLSGSSADVALDAFDAEYRDFAASAVAPGDRLAWRNLRIILARWLEAHPPAALPFIVRHAEIDFEVPLDHAGEFILTGRLDGIGELRETGDIVVLEHKTTRSVSPYWASQFRMSSQVSGYTFAARQHLKGEAVVGAIINAIQFDRLPSDPVRRCKTHALPFAECGPMHATWQLIGPIQRTPAQLAMWRASALTLARAWKATLLAHPTIDTVLELPAEGQFTGACRGCAGADWCEQGRDVALLPQLLQRADAAEGGTP